MSGTGALAPQAAADSALDHDRGKRKSRSCTDASAEDRSPGALVAASKDLMHNIIMRLQYNNLGAILLTRKSWRSLITSDLKAHLELAELRHELRSQIAARRAVERELRETTGKIQVAVRVKPNGPSERESSLPAIFVTDEQSCSVPGRPGTKSSRYEFDAVFSQHTTQREVYQHVRQLVKSAKDGFNVSILSYGQNGAGKTHTLVGKEGDGGIMPRAVAELFALPAGVTVTVQASVLEVFQNSLRDLLAAAPDSWEPSPRLVIKSGSKGQVVVDGAQMRDARHPEEVLAVFTEGCSRRTRCTRRTTAEGPRNPVSASSVVYSLYLEYTDSNNGTKSFSKLTFADLVGSGGPAATLPSAAAELSPPAVRAVNDVVDVLARRGSFIPYRNHKLATLLKDALGGDAKTQVIVSLSASPQDASITKSSLDFAAKMRTVSNKPVRHVERAETARTLAVIQSLQGIGRL